MTCDEHERLAIESSRGVFPPDAREPAREHTANCPRCATQLARHAAAARALRELAAEDAMRQASPNVEAAVLAAWRARRGDAAGLPARAVDEIVGGQGRRVVAWKPSLATLTRVAAGVAVAAALALTVLMRTGSQVPDARPRPLEPRAAAGADGMNPPRPSASPRPLPSVESWSLQSSSTRAEAAPRMSERGVRPPSRSSAVSRVAAARGTTRVTETTHRDAPRSTARVVPAEAPVPAVRAAFVALPYVEPPGPTEMWQIVRVTMRSEAVVKAGLSARGLGPSIVADLLVGEDGIARAIRVVDDRVAGDSRRLGEMLPQEN